MDKSPDAFRTISEVATDLDLPQHVLRFWETRFVQIKPLKRGGGRRYYRPDDIDLLKGIRHLLYGEGYTIRGVQRILKEQGVRFVMDVWQEGAPQPPPAGQRWESEAEPLERELPAPRVTTAAEWAPEPEPEFDDLGPYDEPTAWPVHAEPVDEPPLPTLAPLATPPVSAPPVEAPRAPFAIGRATPLDPNFHTRNEPSAAVPESDYGDEIEEERAAQALAQRFAPRAAAGPVGEPPPRPRAERIAGFAPPPLRSVPSEPVPLRAPPIDSTTGRRPPIDPATGRPAIEPPPLNAGPSMPSRLPAGLRPTTAPTAEPQRGGLGHLLDRLRPSQAPVEGDDAAPALRSVQSLSRDEIRRLQSTLFELLECKRLLDQAR